MLRPSRPRRPNSCSVMTAPRDGLALSLITRISHADSPSGGVFLRISASQNPFSPQRITRYACVAKGTCSLIFEKTRSPVFAECYLGESLLLGVSEYRAAA